MHATTMNTLKAILGASALMAGFAGADILGPPPYQVKDRHDVNLQSGQASPSVTDISIGGALGLSHTVTTYTSNFVNWDDELNRGTINYGGFPEPYTATAGAIYWDVTRDRDQRVMRVVADNSTTDFYYNDAQTLFSPKTDSRYSLQRVNNPTNPAVYHQSIIDFNNSINGGMVGLLMSKPDGTLIYLPNEGEYLGMSNPTNGTTPTNWTKPASSTGPTLSVDMPPSPDIDGNFTIKWTGNGHHSYLTRYDNGSNTGSAQGSGNMGNGTIPQAITASGTYDYVVTTCPGATSNDCITSPYLTIRVEFPAPLRGLSVAYIQRPNGLVVTSKYFSASRNNPVSVTTNTGFQLKYIYQFNGINDGQTAANLPSATSGWSFSNPKYIIGINNAVAGCPTGDYLVKRTANPAFSNEGYSLEDLLQYICPGLSSTKWPTVTYSWPDGMPLAMFQSVRSFIIKDAENNTTEFVHSPIDNKQLTPEFPYLNSVRVTQVKKNGKVLMNYAYETRSGADAGWVCTRGSNGISSCSGLTAPNATPRAILTKSWIDTDTIDYLIGVSGNPERKEFGSTSTGTKVVSLVYSDRYGIRNLNAWDKSVTFDSNASNRLRYVENTIGKTIRVAYDDTVAVDPPADPQMAPGTAKSQNVYKLIETASLTDTATLETKAEGYIKCSLLNYKICNQPTKITDPRGNVTDYEYDPASGLVAKVTQPADKNDVRPQTRYQYTPLYAYYKKDGASTVTKASLPVYLLTRESKCLTSAAKTDGTGCSAANDEIITTYDYGPQNGTANNLLLRSVAVSAYTNEGGTQPRIRRTCYSYDDYGNRIGETKPNGSCN